MYCINDISPGAMYAFKHDILHEISDELESVSYLLEIRERPCLPDSGPEGQSEVSFPRCARILDTLLTCRNRVTLFTL